MSPELKALHMKAYGYDYDHALDHRDGLDVEDGDYPDDEFLLHWTEDFIQMTEAEAV
jgi:hypothetical protein